MRRRLVLGAWDPKLGACGSVWDIVRDLRRDGTTIILTTHYIEEAEEMADRIGVINKGEIILVEEKAELMRKLGKKQLTLELREAMAAVPAGLSRHRLTLAADGRELHDTVAAINVGDYLPLAGGAVAAVRDRYTMGGAQTGDALGTSLR